MPAHIPRPGIKKIMFFNSNSYLTSCFVRLDYADHPDGHPLSEIAERGSTNVKVLTDEEIEGLKVSCKVILALYCNPILSCQIRNLFPKESFIKLNYPSYDGYFIKDF